MTENYSDWSNAKGSAVQSTAWAIAAAVLVYSCNETNQAEERTKQVKAAAESDSKQTIESIEFRLRSLEAGRPQPQQVEKP